MVVFTNEPDDGDIVLLEEAYAKVGEWFHPVPELLQFIESLAGGAMSDAAIDYATLHTDAVQPDPDCRRCGKHPARYGKDGMCGGCHKAAQWAAAHGRLDEFLRASGRQ